MNSTELLQQRVDKIQSFLCVGLDPQLSVLKHFGMENKLFEYNKAIIDEVASVACAFKPQFAHYAALGMEQALLETCQYIKDNYPDIPVILDAKRGDIGSTAEKYAEEAFTRYNVDAVTVNPYMGSDTLTPFFSHKNKATVVLIKTSNPSSGEIQNLRLENGMKLYEHLAKSLVSKYPAANLWFVVGATQVTELKEIRNYSPNVTFLVPGVGTQGGDSDAVVANAMTADGYGLVISVSRGISALTSDSADFYDYLVNVRNKAFEYHTQIKQARLKQLSST